MKHQKNLTVTLIEPRSFCFGVCRALQILDDLGDQSCYVFHEIVHNKQVVAAYQAKGFHFVDEVRDIPDGACVVVSAHGAASSVFETLAAKGCRVIDATCPFVKKVHAAAGRLEASGAAVLIIGKKGHAEVVGIEGRVQNGYVVSSASEVAFLPDFDKVGCVMQTTLSAAKVDSVVAALLKRWPALIVPPKHTMCRATVVRQQAVRDAAQTCDVILVVGDTHSSNSRELVDVAQNAGCRAYLIETPADTDALDLSGTVGLTASASAPESIVRAVYQKLTGSPAKACSSDRTC